MNRYVYIYITLFILSISTIFSQNDQGYLGIKGSVKVDRSPLQGAKILVFKNGIQEKSYPVDAKGKFEISIDLNYQYEIVVAKQGYYSKKLWFNTEVPKDEVGIWNYKFLMTMIPSIEGFDASLLEKPIGKIMYVDKVGEFDYDEEYTFNMLKQLEALMKQYEKARREAFKKLIAQADAAFNDKDYDLAIELYDLSIDLDPYDPYPDDQMYMIGKIIHDDENAQKNYDKNVSLADGYYQNKDYVNAKKFYNRAINYIEKAYPKDQIALIDDMLNNEDALLADQAAKEKAYVAAIAAGDRLMTAKQYENSLSKYTEASGIKPTEQYPKDKIAELNLLIAQLNKDKNSKEELERAYRDAIASADAGFGKKDYTGARLNYIKASQLIPAETYPKTKITEIDNLLAANKSVDEKYKGFIAVADQAFTSKNYEAAKTNYKQALSIKNNEIYPISKIKEIDALLVLILQQRQKDVDGNYARYIIAADGAFNKKDYEMAKTNYTQALSLKNSETYPKNKITEIDKILADIANKKREYDLSIARADNNFNIDKWQEAKVDYQKALTFFPTEQYPQTRLNEIENKLLALKGAKEQRLARENSYNEAINKADALFVEEKYQESKNSYSQALALKNNEVYPKKRITEIEKLLAAKKMLDDRYNTIIAAADRQFLNETYEDAKITYGNAIKVKATEAYPKQKIAEIDLLLASKKDVDDRYNAIIVTADGHFNSKDYTDAKVTYTNALQLKSNEAYPKQKIAEIDNILASQHAMEKRYNDIIASADQHFLNEKYNEAKATYTNALQIKPTESYPKQKISEIDVLLAKRLAAKAKYDQNKKQYDQLIAQADGQFNAKVYAQAKALYQQATTVIPTEIYPKQKVVEIDNLLAGEVEKNKKYKEALTIADQLFESKSYGEALAFYNQASSVKPTEEYPKGKIIEINSILESLRKNESAYGNYIKLADAAFSSSELEAAKGQYQAASAVKPSETYPKQRIAEIDKLLEEQTRLAGEKEKLESQYKTFIANADLGFNQKNYLQAKEKYVNASRLKPHEMYPKERIAEIDNIVETLAAQQKAYDAKMLEGSQLYSVKNYNGALAAYQQALQLKPNEVLPKQKIGEIQNIINANTKKQEQYESMIAQADILFNSKDYSGAKPMYQQANSLMPTESYPKSQISRIDALVAEQVRLAGEHEKLESQYKAFIANADLGFNQKKYLQAKEKYVNASRLKPQEMYPKERIAEIDNIVETLAAQQKAYDTKMLEGSQLYSAKNYNGALAAYQQALQLKPNEVLPKQKMGEIQNIINANSKKQEQYESMVAQADILFNSKDYSGAKPMYQQANSLMPTESYPKSQISRIDALVAEAIKRKAELESQLKAYNSKISEADKFFDSKNYDNAISAYMDAKMIKTNENYPDQQIAKINQITKANAAQLEANYTAAIKNGDQLKNSKSYNEAKQQYSVALNLKPNDDIAKAKIAEIGNLIEQDARANAEQAKLDEAYKRSISQGDGAFRGNNYPAAIAHYKSALGLKANEKYPQDQIDISERKIQEAKALAAAEEEKRRKSELAASQSSFNKNDFDYSGEERDRTFLNELSKQYPEGVTIENYDKPNKKIKRVIVNRGGIAKEYIEVKYSYGTYYFRNGQNISRSIFYSETKK